MNEENNLMKQTQQVDILQEETAPEMPAQEQTDTKEEILLQEETTPVSGNDAAEDLGKDSSEEASPIAPPLPYHERYYLKYREGKRNSPLDLEGTRAFLQILGFDGGELRQAREGRTHAETFRNADRKAQNQVRCAYCGKEIGGVEFNRLPDGRVRCTACSDSAVTSMDEMTQLCQRVIANMENYFGAVIDVPVAVEVVDERRIKRKMGIPLGGRDSQSILILGAAVNNKNQYSILLENGAPRISLIATFAHELTHIWQYTHWDNRENFRKCPENNRLLIYEGMAKWVEIQYLYLIGEINVAKREEFITRNRKDAYGQGFLLYEDQYPLSRKPMMCRQTPFTPDRYPLE